MGSLNHEVVICYASPSHIIVTQRPHTPSRATHSTKTLYFNTPSKAQATQTLPQRTTPTSSTMSNQSQNSSSSYYSSSSYSSTSYSSSSSTNPQGTTTHFTQSTQTNPDGTTIHRTAEQTGRQPYSETTHVPAGGRIGSGGSGGSSSRRDARRIEDVSDADAEREYEERIEDEYARREGGA